nr:lipid-A-disaccharide synthase [Geomonas sp. RF6]
MQRKSASVMIVAGEASGDMYGAELATRILDAAPGTAICGMGGDRMREAGVETLVDANTMAVMGLVEVLAHFPVIYRGFKLLQRRLEKDPPRLLVLIDYPDFNLRLAKVAKRAGVKVLYFVSPQVWAWRSGRVKGIGKVVDRMAVLFPFEVPYYERESIPVSFVGHPLVDMVHRTLSREDAVASLGLERGKPTVGLFPGSRRSEIEMLLPAILESARLIREKIPEVQFVLPLASSLRPEHLAPYLDPFPLEIKVVPGRNHDVMSACDAVISVSGTVTMELALIGTPMVIIYKVSPLTYEIGKRVIKVDHIGICNIVAGERVVKELIQHDAEPAAISAEIEKIIKDEAYAEKIRAGLATVREKLGSGGALSRLAELALEMKD